MSRLYALRSWIEQSYKQIKNSLGWAHYQVRSDLAIRRHWELVCCTFCFCWWAYTREHEALLLDPASDAHSIAEKAGGKGKQAEEGRPSLSWPVALRRVRGWLDPWVMLWRYWRAWSKVPPPPQLRALLDEVGRGHSLDVYVPA